MWWLRGLISVRTKEISRKGRLLRTLHKVNGEGYSKARGGRQEDSHRIGIKIIYEINDLAINPNVFENHKFKRKNQIQSNIRLQFYDENNCKNKSSLIIKFLLISISFCLMSIPIEIIKMIHNCNSDYFILFKTVSELLQYLSHSVNFLLYCISGKSLREEVKRFLKCFK